MNNEEAKNNSEKVQVVRNGLEPIWLKKEPNRERRAFISGYGKSQAP